MDKTNGVAVGLVVVARHVPTANANAHGHGKARALAKRADEVLGVNKLKLSGNVKVAAGNGGRSLYVDARGSRLARAHRAEHETLNVEDDVRYVLIHTGDRGELVLNAIDLNCLNRSALERREQHATERVAQRVTVTALERLGTYASERIAYLFHRHLGPDEFGHVYLQPDAVYYLE